MTLNVFSYICPLTTWGTHLNQTHIHSKTKLLQEQLLNWIFVQIVLLLNQFLVGSGAGVGVVPKYVHDVCLAVLPLISLYLIQQGLNIYVKVFWRLTLLNLCHWFCNEANGRWVPSKGVGFVDILKVWELEGPVILESIHYFPCLFQLLMVQHPIASLLIQFETPIRLLWFTSVEHLDRIIRVLWIGVLSGSWH